MNWYEYLKTEQLERALNGRLPPHARAQILQALWHKKYSLEAQHGQYS